MVSRQSEEYLLMQIVATIKNHEIFSNNKYLLGFQHYSTGHHSQATHRSPPGTRIFAITEVADALTTDRARI